MKLLLLDMDETVRKPISNNKFINKPDDQKLIDGVTEAIARYPDWKIIGITNQGGVAAGFKSFEDCVEEQRRTMEMVPRIGLICFCTNAGESFFRLGRFNGNIRPLPTENKNNKTWGNFRKPNPGMLNFAKAYYGVVTEILMVGDREEDQLAAQAAGVEFLWAQTWRSNK
jgi:D-glycero-D-manno-heptose 1,7-bisphosphate phosphatase